MFANSRGLSYLINLKEKRVKVFVGYPKDLRRQAGELEQFQQAVEILYKSAVNPPRVF